MKITRLFSVVSSRKLAGVRILAFASMNFFSKNSTRFKLRIPLAEACLPYSLSVLLLNIFSGLELVREQMQLHLCQLYFIWKAETLQEQSGVQIQKVIQTHD